MNTIQAINKKIENAKKLDFGILFNECFELFKKTWLQGFLLVIFSILIMLPLIIVVYMPLITMAVTQQENFSSDFDVYGEFFAGMSVIYILFLILSVLALSTITYALTAAYMRIIKKIDHNETFTTSDFFYYLKINHLSKIFLIMIVSILIAIPATLLCYLPLIYVMVPISFFYIFFAFNPEMSVSDIVSASFKLGNKKWFLTFGLLIVIYLIVLLGTLITCGIGQLFFQAILYHPAYLI